MSELKSIRDWPKALFTAGSFQLVVYLYTACTTYAFAGYASARGMVTELVVKDGVYIAANLMLFLHISVAFVIKCVVLGRALHRVVHPKSINESTWEARGVWFGITTGVLVFCFVVSQSIPAF